MKNFTGEATSKAKHLALDVSENVKDFSEEAAENVKNSPVTPLRM
ncbi:hypothetical protein [Arthrobacter polaris]|nr:hypothetical protein [Arthrobacter polaris]